MTIRHLRIFLEVFQQKSMSKAAENLHFSQSTISQVIKELEEHYNTLLFERLSKRLYVSESGKKLQLHAKNVVEQFDKLQIIMHSDSLVEHVRMGATITCGCCILPQFTKDFQARFPEVDLVSSINNTHIIEEKLLKGELDIALVEGNIQSRDLISTPIIDDHLVLAFHQEHEFNSKKSFTPSDLANKDFVVREDGSGTRASFEKYLERHNISMHAKIEAPFPEAMRHAIIYNNCLAVMSERLLESEIKSGIISILRLETDEWNRHFSLVHHKDKYLTNALQYIFTLMSQYQT